MVDRLVAGRAGHGADDPVGRVAAERQRRPFLRPAEVAVYGFTHDGRERDAALSGYLGFVKEPELSTAKGPRPLAGVGCVTHVPGLKCHLSPRPLRRPPISFGESEPCAQVCQAQPPRGNRLAAQQ